MTSHATCLQHVPFEGPGVFEAALGHRGIRLERYLVPEEGFPTHPGDLLIIMGGPMSVNDPLPWVEQEGAFVRAALDSGTPTVGVCLGSQFMAKALGATVRPGPALEIGMTPIRLTGEGRKDRVFSSLPDTFDVFEWHGEVFDPPPGAVSLASSDTAPVQAFRYGARAYGLLFHPELEPAGIAALCRACPGDLARAALTPEAVLAQARPHLTRLHRWADALLGHLLASPR